jgi:hypothetical protein
MKNTDVNVVEFLPENNSTYYTIYDGWSFKYGIPQSDISLKGTNDLKNVEYKIENNKPIVTYTRKLKTDDQFDKEVLLVNIF